MIEWHPVTSTSIPIDKPILFRVRGEPLPRVGIYDTGFPEGFDDHYACEHFRTKRVSHWASVNMP